MSTEDSILGELEKIAQEAFDKGWSLTREATGILDPNRKEALVDEAEQAYKSPIQYIEDKRDANPDLAGLFDTEALKVDINVFDLYRRVGRLEQALQLGMPTYETAKSMKNPELINKANHFLRLAIEAKGYELLKQGENDEALGSFSQSIQLYEDNPALDSVHGKNAVMLYSNTAAVYIMAAEIKERSGEEAELDKQEAYGLIQKAEKELEGMESGQDKENWKANILCSYGRLAALENDQKRAKDYFSQAADTAEGTDYESLKLSALTHLAYTYHLMDDKEHAEEVFSKVEEHLKQRDFGIYEGIYRPMVDEMTQSLR
jgi:hypothetical protein